MARALLPRLADQPDLRGHQRDPADRHRPRPAQAGRVLSPIRARLPAALLALALLSLGACSEEDRKAWVSILPGSDETEEEADTLAVPEGFALTADSTAAVLDGDTLLSIERLPARGPGGVDLEATRFGRVLLSPDSTYVGFTTSGEAPVVGVWTRARQSARLFAARPESDVERIEWSPGGRFLVWQSVGAEGVTTVGGYDLRVGTALRHPVLAWLERGGRSVWIQQWTDDTRLRLLVGPGAAREGGLAWVWEMHGGSLVVEDQVEPLARNAPPGSQLLAGGAFSLDLLGDAAPESVALYISADTEPSAMVLRNLPTGHDATTTEPLVPLAVLELETWKGIRRGAELTEIVEVAGRPVLLLSIPVPESPISTLGFFAVRPDGSVDLVQAGGTEGATPALFPDGRTAERLFDLGLSDLDGDGRVEVVAAVGRYDPASLEPRLEWGVQVWRWEAGPRLVPVPELEEAAIKRIRSLTEADDES